MEQFDRNLVDEGRTRFAKQILVIFTLGALSIGMGTSESVAQQSENTLSKKGGDKAVATVLLDSQTSSDDLTKGKTVAANVDNADSALKKETFSDKSGLSDAEVEAAAMAIAVLTSPKTGKKAPRVDLINTQYDTLPMQLPIQYPKADKKPG